MSNSAGLSGHDELPLDGQKLTRMKWMILKEVKDNLATRTYRTEQMVERIRKIIEKEAR